MNITIDDASPQFNYYSAGSTWMQNHTDDGDTGRYFRGTFYGTKTDGDTMSLTFNGTAVYIYGARRPNHGIYSTQLDGGSVSLQLGYQGDTLFQDVLFSATGLSATQEHTVTMINLPSRTNPPGNGSIEWWLDIDYAIITASDQTDKVYTTTYDDTVSDAVQYLGLGWSLSPPRSEYLNTTSHVTNTVGNTMQLKFNGSSVQLFGQLGNDHGNYSINLDGRLQPDVFNGTFYKWQPKVELYTASGLSDEPHVLTMTNFGQGPKNNVMGFDFAVVNSTIDPKAGQNGTAGGTNTTVSDGTNSGHNDQSGGGSNNTAAIAGGAAGGAVALILFAILAWFFVRRSKAKKEDSTYVRRSNGPMDLDGGEVKPFQHGDNAYHYPLLSSSSSDAAEGGQGYAQPSPLSGNQAQQQGAREMDQSRTPFLTAVPPPPPSNATSYPRSVNPPSSAGANSPPPMPEQLNPFSNAASSATFGHNHGSSTNPSSAGDSDSTGQPYTSTAVGAKTLGVALPYTARPPQTSPASPGSALSEEGHDETTSPQPRPPFAVEGERERRSSIGSAARRMYVPGREVDVGPLPVVPHDGDDDEDEAHKAYGILPPDYHQATEPLPGQRRG